GSAARPVPSTCDSTTTSTRAISCSATARSIASATSTTSALTPEFIRGLPVPIRRVATVLRIVLPIAALAIDVAVEIVVLIVVIIVVDLNVPTVPIAVAPVATPRTPGSGTERNSCAPRQSCSRHITRIGVGIIGISRRSSSVNNLGIVRRHVNYVRLSWFNGDHLPAAATRTASDCLGLYHLLRACL